MAKGGSKVTNEEKIKSMSTEQLADRLLWMSTSRSQGGDDIFWHSPSGFFSWFKEEAFNDCVKWLKEETGDSLSVFTKVHNRADGNTTASN